VAVATRPSFVAFAKLVGFTIVLAICARGAFEAFSKIYPDQAWVIEKITVIAYVIVLGVCVVKPFFRDLGYTRDKPGGTRGGT
jgi:hypothetical protein